MLCDYKLYIYHTFSIALTVRFKLNDKATNELKDYERKMGTLHSTST